MSGFVDVLIDNRSITNDVCIWVCVHADKRNNRLIIDPLLTMCVCGFVCMQTSATTD